jgi:hypothetical protein
MLSVMAQPPSEELDNLLQALRAEGAGRITALAAIRSLTGCGIVEAQATLDVHPSWGAPPTVPREDDDPAQWDPAELLLYAADYLDLYVLFRFGDEPMPSLATGYLESVLDCLDGARESLERRTAGSALGDIPEA